jgi:hypothetical protein
MEIGAVNTHRSYVPDYWRYEVRCYDDRTAPPTAYIVVDCIFASEEKGEAIVLVTDENGIKQRKVKAGEAPGPEINRVTGRIVISKTDAPVTERYSRFYLNIFGSQHRIVSAGRA